MFFCCVTLYISHVQLIGYDSFYSNNFIFHQLSRDNWEPGGFSDDSLAIMKELIAAKTNKCMILIIWNNIKTYFSILFEAVIPDAKCRFPFASGEKTFSYFL